MLLSFVIAVLYHNVDLRPALGRVGGGGRGILWSYEIFEAYIDGP